MIRSDVFRDFRARKINSTPAPAEFFGVVNYTVAQHLADVPVVLTPGHNRRSQIRLS